MKVNPELVESEPSFTRDIRAIGHFGTGNLEKSIRSDDDLARAKDLILKRYEAN